MKTLLGTTVVIALLMPGICAGQSLTLEQLAQRIAALEQKVAELESEKQALLEAMPSASASVSQAAEPLSALAPPRPVNLASAEKASEAGAGLWSGPYFGLSLTTNETTYAMGSRSVTEDAISAGPLFGYRWQAGPFVTGLEIAAERHEESYVLVNPGAAPTFLRPDRTVGVRGMAGLAWSNWLGYGFWGIRSNSIRHKVSWPDGNQIYQSNHTEPYFGVGGAYLLGERTSLEVELSSYDDHRQTNYPVDIGGDSWSVRLNQKF